MDNNFSSVYTKVNITKFFLENYKQAIFKMEKEEDLNILLLIDFSFSFKFPI